MLSRILFLRSNVETKVESKMEYTSRPRFHALIWGQMMGLLILGAGMIAYWVRSDGVPRTITWRFIGIGSYFFLTFLIPEFINSTLPSFVALLSKNRRRSGDSQWLADNPRI